MQFIMMMEMRDFTELSNYNLLLKDHSSDLDT